MYRLKQQTFNIRIQVQRDLYLTISKREVIIRFVRMQVLIQLLTAQTVNNHFFKA